MMNTFAIVPVKTFENAKMRLSSILDKEDRIHLSSLMLDYTLRVLDSVPLLTQIVLVSGDKRAELIAAKYGATFLREEKDSGVNSAVAVADSYCMKKDADATIVIPHDLPLLDAIDISRVSNFAKNESRCIVICPSLRYDGTNMLLRKPPCVIGTFYDSDSYNTHVKSAIKLGIPVKLLISKNVMCDIDTPEDAMQIVKEAEAGDTKTIDFLKTKF
jgi:2-phospho-L-lactate/phosphoenolpyruvate guanylyltransferase